MKKIVIATLLLLSLYAENNTTTKASQIDELNSTKIEQNSTTTQNRASQQLKKQMEREAKFAKEQRFYQGEDYDLSYAEVDPNSLDSIPLIEPDYDFNMDDVYD